MSKTAIPFAPLCLGLAGLIPFIWGVATLFSRPLNGWTQSAIGVQFASPIVQLFYGAVILSFMSGVLWGFATHLPKRTAPFGYVLSVIPALWVFFTWVFFTSGDIVRGGGLALIAGFVGILGLDWFFWRAAAAPPWWLKLRVVITICVVGCLGLTVLLG